MEWREMKKKKCGSQTATNRRVTKGYQKWVAPGEGDLKLNIDSSFTVGMVLRDHTDHFVEGGNLRIVGIVTVFEAETRGVLEFGETMSERNVIVVSDSLLAANAICKSVMYQHEVGHILDECREILESKRNISLYFIKRQANNTTHLMDHVPCHIHYYYIFRLLLLLCWRLLSLILLYINKCSLSFQKKLSTLVTTFFFIYIIIMSFSHYLATHSNPVNKISYFYHFKRPR